MLVSSDFEILSFSPFPAREVVDEGCEPRQKRDFGETKDQVSEEPKNVGREPHSKFHFSESARYHK